MANQDLYSTNGIEKQIKDAEAEHLRVPTGKQPKSLVNRLTHLMKDTKSSA
jgi:hypothetical protein